jgi:RNase P/RNase MRP subunit POP5
MHRAKRAIADINSLVVDFSFNRGLTDAEKEAINMLKAALQLVKRAEATLAIQAVRSKSQ